MVELLEREAASAALFGALAEARQGSGGVVLVAGEAGIGKTSLVRSFIDHAAGIDRFLHGGCDPLETPRPLGPLIDAAQAIDRNLARRIAAGLPRAEAFAAALDLIDGVDGTTVFLLEDLHWADDATLDLFTFLSRRMEDRRALLVATFRSDEVDASHPLRIRLGDADVSLKGRLDLEPLTAPAVAALIGTRSSGTSALDPEHVHRATGGNPFFVSEMVAAAAGTADTQRGVPTTVRDAVIARASRLHESARDMLDVASVVPGAAPPWLLHAIAASTAASAEDGLSRCLQLGLLRERGDGTIEFRHELARHAIEESIGLARRRQLHAAALAAIRAIDVIPDHGRLAHHAAGADDGLAVTMHAPLAAADAVEIGAYREAAGFLRSALRYGHLIGPARRSEIVIEYGDVLTTLGEYEDAHDAYLRAVAEAQALGAAELQAKAYIASGRALWGLGRQPTYLDHLDRAEHLLGADPPLTPTLAQLQGARCREHMLAREHEAAEAHGRQAMDLATRLEDARLYAEVAIQSGISRCMAGDDNGLSRVRRGIDVAAEQGADTLIALGHSQIGSGYGELRRYDVAIPALRDGIAFGDARELTSYTLYLHAWLARCELEIGAWEAAADRVSALVANPRCLGNTRLVALVTLAWLRSRRGDPGVVELLDEALDLARRSQHVQRLWPVAACRAEHAWVHDRLEDELGVVEEAYSMAAGIGYRPAMEELSHWLTLAARDIDVESDAGRTPFALSADGRFAEAAEQWRERGCPYEEATAQLLTGDKARIRAAFRMFDDLGAGPLRIRAAERLRALGEPVPRGPNRATAGNPHQLTAREMDVLDQIPTGATNAEIANALGISERTVAHHVSRILSKMAVKTRAEAAVIADRSRSS